MKTPKNLTTESIKKYHQLYLAVGNHLHINNLKDIDGFTSELLGLSCFTVAVSPTVMCDCMTLMLGVSAVCEPERFEDVSAFFKEFIV